MSTASQFVEFWFRTSQWVPIDLRGRRTFAFSNLHTGLELLREFFLVGVKQLPFINLNGLHNCVPIVHSRSRTTSRPTRSGSDALDPLILVTVNLVSDGLYRGSGMKHVESTQLHSPKRPPSRECYRLDAENEDGKGEGGGVERSMRVSALYTHTAITGGVRSPRQAIFAAHDRAFVWADPCGVELASWEANAHAPLHPKFESTSAPSSWRRGVKLTSGVPSLVPTVMAVTETWWRRQVVWAARFSSVDSRKPEWPRAMAIRSVGPGASPGVTNRKLKGEKEHKARVDAVGKVFTESRITQHHSTLFLPQWVRCPWGHCISESSLYLSTDEIDDRRAPMPARCQVCIIPLLSGVESRRVAPLAEGEERVKVKVASPMSGGSAATDTELGSGCHSGFDETRPDSTCGSQSGKERVRIRGRSPERKGETRSAVCTQKKAGRSVAVVPQRRRIARVLPDPLPDRRTVVQTWMTWGSGVLV
ncbi:hypothetical protein K438DRAFT_1760996 [Mycena galopus ATCC 62051]|nr:hypothetical protein K438DRAFT_1760996 [Mycena galopus ATCC 62051]